MTVEVDIEVEKAVSESVPVRETAEMVIREALQELSCPYDIHIDLLLTDDAAIREINRDSRGIDAPTDVLSFPYCEYDYPCDWSGIEKQTDIFHPETGELLLGEIVISSDKVKEQAEEYGHSQEREFAFLIVHSVLHLCGYDHMTEDDRTIMENLQRIILDRLGITRQR